MGGDGYVTYDIPNEISFEQNGKRKLSAKVCSVHLEQQPLQFEVDGEDTFSFDVQYTVGGWGTTVLNKRKLSLVE